MTALVCWCGVDSRGASSLNITTDSRFSWPDKRVWNHGRKLSVRMGSAEILAFAGDVTFAQNVFLSMFQDHVTDATLSHGLEQLSKGYSNEQLRGTAVVLARRIGSGMKATFVVTAYEFKDRIWRVVKHAIPAKHSDVICSYGTGGRSAMREARRWMEQDVSGRTSRSVFSGFCASLRLDADPCTGAPPQLAGLYREGPAVEFGIVWDDALFIAGQNPPPDMDLHRFEWRNELLERCDPSTMKLIVGAQPHARPYKFR